MLVQSPEFRHVTEDALREWKSSTSTGYKIQSPVPMDRFLYELCWALVRGDLPIQRCKVALESVEFSDTKLTEGMDSVFADIIAHLAQDPTIPGECRIRLVKLTKWLVDSSLVPYRLLQERCEEDFLWESDVIKMKAQDLRTKEIRVNTRLLYQQTKFNLLREESEGYAKLVTLLSQIGSEAITKSTSVATISIIKSLIGHFDLDPNRVFDIVLECFECHPDSSIFYSLIPIFQKSNASQILGFKFQYYQRMDVKNPVPFALYRLAALMVRADFIDLDSVCAHLLPKVDEAIDHYKLFLEKRLDEVNKIGKINLAATGKDLMEEEKQEATDLLLALDMEHEAVTERYHELENNQWLGLLIGFLSIDDWCHAQKLFDRLSLLNPVEHIQICDELLRLINKSVSPAYAMISQMSYQCGEGLKSPNVDSLEVSTDSSQPSSLIDLPKEVFQMLSLAGPYLSRDALLLQKVCRVLKAYYLSAQSLVGSSENAVYSDFSLMGSKGICFRYNKDAKVRVEEALGSCLLPSLQLIPANPAVGQEIWDVLCLVPYEVRYRLYGEWEKEDEQFPVLLASRQIAKLETRRILKRLAKENLKQRGRMVAKLAHANPMTVLRTIVHQIEAYKDMITPVVDAFKYLTQLEYDILEYVVIERLAQGGRDKLKDDGLNLSDWLQSLASFWGHLCKKYPSMELRGLFQYLINQLKKGIGIELVLLQELIEHMANIQYMENMTEDQLDAMAGSETLRNQAFGTTKNNKAILKSSNRLRDSLLPKDESMLAIPLLLLIAQHRSMVVINADVPYIKMVSEQFDRCQAVLLHYVDFLSSALTPATTYAQLLPTLDDLVHKYHLDPEVAFLIYRPVMRLFKCSSRPEICWPLEGGDEANMQNEDVEASLPHDNLLLDLGPHWKPIMWSDFLNTIHTMLPTKAWNSLSPDLYATFWGLSLFDLYVPRKRYNSEISKYHDALKALEEVSDNSSSAITKRKKEKERIQELLDKLTIEMQKHEQHVASVRRRLTYEKDRWLTSCLDTLKINIEFFQRCVFPRCIFSMSDAVYCAMFVQTLHSLATPYFNTVNHIDIFICKTLQPMICCCTEYEAGRLGRFLHETLKMVYYWKSDESIYERECGNKPGFAVYYRFPNSQRLSFSQFVKVHIKWSTRITKLFIQCLESTEYMEIRNALITLAKISGVFPVTRKSGINLEKRVAKIKLDEREDLKVLATGVAAALSARKSSWVSEEEFGMGYIDPKPAASGKLAGNSINLQNGSLANLSSEIAGMKNGTAAAQVVVSSHNLRDQSLRAKHTDGRGDRSESELPLQKMRGLITSNIEVSSANLMPSSSKTGSQKNVSDVGKAPYEESSTKIALKAATELESRSKRSTQTNLSKQQRAEILKDDIKTTKSGKNASQLSAMNGERELWSHSSEGRQFEAFSIPSNANAAMNADLHVSLSNAEAGTVRSVEPRFASGKDGDNFDIPEISRATTSRVTDLAALDDFSSSRGSDKQPKRSGIEEQDRVIKRRKGENEVKDGHLLDHERPGSEDQIRNKPAEKLIDKTRDKNGERYDKDQRDKIDRSDKTRTEDILDKSRDRSVERYGREHSVDRVQERGERGSDRIVDKSRDERSKLRHSEIALDKLHPDERFHGQSLPPPPPFLPVSFVPQSVGVNRREEDADRRATTTRHSQRLSPRHDEKERRHSEENLLSSQDEAKRRREDDFRERKQDEWDGSSLKVDDREREKLGFSKDDMDATAASKRRKLKRELPSNEAGREYSPVALRSHSPIPLGISQPPDGRERDRKGAMMHHRGSYMEETPRVHGKEASKIQRRENDQAFERDWDEEKRLRTEAKRKHRK